MIPTSWPFSYEALTEDAPDVHSADGDVCSGEPPAEAVQAPTTKTTTTHAATRFREDLKVNLDWDAWLRLAAQPGAFAYVRQTLMLHRIHAGSETSDGIRAGVRAREDLMMFRAQWPAPIARVLARAYAMSYATGDEA